MDAVAVYCTVCARGSLAILFIFPQLTTCLPENFTIKSNLFKSCFGHFMHTLVQKCMISSSLLGNNEINCTICGIVIPAALIILWHERH